MDGLIIITSIVRRYAHTTVRQDVKHEIKRDPRGNTTVTDLTMENVDPNDGAGVDEIMQVTNQKGQKGGPAWSGQKDAVCPI